MEGRQAQDTNVSGVITLQKFAEQSGMEEGVVLGWIKKGYLPTKRIGKYTLINLVVWHSELRGIDPLCDDSEL